jgi:hypothetical protein
MLIKEWQLLIWIRLIMEFHQGRIFYGVCCKYCYGIRIVEIKLIMPAICREKVVKSIERTL